MNVHVAIQEGNNVKVIRRKINALDLNIVKTYAMLTKNII